MLTTILVLTIVGILAILFEMVLPGGILGVLGALCLVAVVVISFVTYGPMWGMVSLVTLVLFCGIMTWIWMKYLHRLPFTRKLMLNEQVGEDDELRARQSLIGQTGEVISDLRPSGRARINGEKIDVMSQAGVIEKGATVEVVDTRGPSIFVRRV